MPNRSIGGTWRIRFPMSESAQNKCRRHPGRRLPAIAKRRPPLAQEAPDKWLDEVLEPLNGSAFMSAGLAVGAALEGDLCPGKTSGIFGLGIVESHTGRIG